MKGQDVLAEQLQGTRLNIYVRPWKLHLILVLATKLERREERERRVVKQLHRLNIYAANPWK